MTALPIARRRFLTASIAALITERLHASGDASQIEILRGPAAPPERCGTGAGHFV